MRDTRPQAANRRNVCAGRIGRAALRLVVPLLAVLLASASPAQDFSGLARPDMTQSQISDRAGGLEVALRLSQPVPYRILTIDGPPRLVVDFREVDWSGVSRTQLLNSDLASDARFGAFRPGWSRLVVDLTGPMRVVEGGMRVDPASSVADLLIRLEPSSAEAFAAAAGAPPDPHWDLTPEAPPAADPEDPTIVVAIDPGHGGIDPGAERDGVKEGDLMLQLGLELAEAINRTVGLRAVLTRHDDTFVPLDERITLARRAGADLMISLHADALEDDEAHGASVYTLSAEAVDQASQRMAERHEQGDLLAGLDLSGHDDQVATILMDLARQETGPQSNRLADAVVEGLQEAGARLNTRRRRQAELAVLTAADFPSVLVEAGFLSDEGDRRALGSTEGRAPIVAGMVAAILNWVAAEAALAPLHLK